MNGCEKNLPCPPCSRPNEAFFITNYKLDGQTFPDDVLKYAAKRTLFRGYTHFIIEKSPSYYKPDPRVLCSPCYNYDYHIDKNIRFDYFVGINEEKDRLPKSDWNVVMFKHGDDDTIKIPEGKQLYDAAAIMR